MKRQNLYIIIAVAVIAAIMSIVISNAIFGTPQSRPIKVPVVNKIEPTFPDVHNDSDYTSFFNDKALDPTQLIKIGNSKNSKPFKTENQF